MADKGGTVAEPGDTESSRQQEGGPGLSVSCVILDLTDVGQCPAPGEVSEEE